MTLIIAEAGVNHNGDERLALKLIDSAYESGADVVKFQTFKAKKLVTHNATQADYQIANTGKKESQFAMLSRLELSYAAHHRLIAHCDNLGIKFLSTAFDSESLTFLVDELKLRLLKIPSGELTNAPLILKHALTGCDLIVSTGMATLAEVESALSVIAFGLINHEGVEPSEAAFRLAYASLEGQKALSEKVTLLHCTTEYPAPMNEINLRAMDTMRIAFNLPVGYSDHSLGVTIPVAAVARGAVLIEKHFTLDRDMEGPDHKASLEPHELKEMVNSIRDVEIALGNGIKTPQASEIKNKEIARKSLVAAKPIKKGDLFTRENIEIKRPGNGSSPYNYWSIMGRSAVNEYIEGDVIIE
ncbi:N-acetylneuraminate synthase [Yersinia enterocolitica]|uniref:N-acetylneuraminate synthase n=1 Tax=Yersinia enterocolitica TaxID=630 RepID=UPI00155AB13A|nr:N-acetylneuraminate synthase [Yersinia enterocolitica]MBX9482614.1 N-acetylneuraminate synthase [Yersinia enterocolitica]NQS94644.1 N-acetylneuraminate synthase [Yersinia enterocolitica]NQT44854.1 N-acetylneuraminate synthase [Yersinia enterocolitica]NQT99343.1 N-acetylneuraminate synthase [Yersinia enterocolitica]HDL6874747.1 N-acetylneuraminate synthase [Yersinia enterocolitica]